MDILIIQPTAFFVQFCKIVGEKFDRCQRRGLISPIKELRRDNAEKVVSWHTEVGIAIVIQQGVRKSPLCQPRSLVVKDSMGITYI